MAEISNQLKFLSTKKVLLASPGYKLDGNYYSNESAEVNLVETTRSSGRFRQGLPSPSFGSSSQIIIPNQSFIGKTYLHLRLDNIAAADRVFRGFAWAAIDRIAYIFGSSNVSELSMNGQSVFQTAMFQCQTGEQMSHLFDLGGESRNTSGNGPIPVFPDNTIYYNAGSVDGYVLLPLPWSTVNEKKMFDARLLNDPLTLRISFKQKVEFISSTYVPTAFAVAEILIVQDDLSDKSMSLKTEMSRDLALMAPYGFVHKQSFVVPTFAGSSNANDLKSVQLTSFINADLTAIIISLRRNERYLNVDPNPPAVNFPRLPFFFEKMSNIVLSLNGQILYSAPAQGYKSYNMIDMKGTSTMTIEAGSNIAGEGGIPSLPYLNDMVYIDFTAKRTSSYNGLWQNSIRIPNQSITLEFQTASPGDHQLFCTYLYSGLNEVQAGSSNLFFN